jgi:hypothetical protein
MIQIPQWITDLHTKYNHLFETASKDEYGVKQGEPLRGIECSRTWEPIVVRLLESLEWHRTHNTYVLNPNYNGECDSDLDNNQPYIDGGPNMVQIFQIKEKFGRFTAYVKCSDNIRAGVEHAIGYAEGQADLTCYQCGTIGQSKLTSKGWIRRVCEPCENKGELT